MSLLSHFEQTILAYNKQTTVISQWLLVDVFFRSDLSGHISKIGLSFVDGLTIYEEQIHRCHFQTKELSVDQRDGFAWPT